MLDITYTGAIIAGLLSFLSPCILPMVPFYLCYLAGISMNELRNSEDIPSGTHRKLILASVFFALGTTTIFVFLGLGASFLGQMLRVWKQELSYFAAAFLFAFGLHFLGVICFRVEYACLHCLTALLAQFLYFLEFTWQDLSLIHI